MKNFRIIILVSLILIITFAAFYPCLKNGFVGWDDVPYVTDNIVIQDFSLHGVRQIFTSFFVGNYQPVTILSYLFEYRLFKLDPFGYHLTNLILHLLNCLLVFWLIYMLTRNISVSSITALLFSIHPMHVESVAWIAERKDVLYALFFLAAAISYCYYLRKREVRGYYLLSLTLFILSILSKAMAITLPLVLLLIDYFNNRKWDKRALTDKIPFFVLSFIFGALAVIAQHSAGAIRSESSVNLFHRIGIAGYGIVFYLHKILAPIKLSCFYPYSGIKDIFPLLASFVAFIILLTVVILSGKYTRKIIFGSAFFLIIILPVLQFIPIGGTIVADRYVYAASIGIFYILAEGVFWLSTRKIKHSRLLQYLLVVILIMAACALTSLTWQRCRVWRDPVSLWNDTLNKYPNAATAYFSRGNAYRDRGNIQQAASDYNKAIEIDPDYFEAYVNRGNVCKDRGNIQQAFSDYNKAIAIKPDYAEGYSNRGNAYRDQGNVQQAVSDYTRAIAINPNLAGAYSNRGLAYNNQGNFIQAVHDFTRAIEINPNLAEAYNNRGIACYRQGNFTQAFSDYTKAIEINPNDADVYFNRGLAYYSAKDYDNAWRDVHKAEGLGYAINPEFLAQLKNASGREK